MAKERYGDSLNSRGFDHSTLRLRGGHSTTELRPTTFSTNLLQHTWCSCAEPG